MKTSGAHKLVPLFGVCFWLVGSRLYGHISCLKLTIYLQHFSFGIIANALPYFKIAIDFTYRCTKTRTYVSMFLGLHLNLETTFCPCLGSVTALLVTFLTRNQNTFPLSLGFFSYIYLNSPVLISSCFCQLTLPTFFFSGILSFCRLSA